jgi:hypothetical protein
MTIDNSVQLEGRINAHRRLLVEMVSVVAAIPEARNPPGGDGPPRNKDMRTRP